MYSAEAIMLLSLLKLGCLVQLWFGKGRGTSELGDSRRRIVTNGASAATVPPSTIPPGLRRTVHGRT